MKSALHSRYFDEACNERWDPSPRLSAWSTQLRRNIAAVASRADTVPIWPIWESNPDLLYCWRFLLLQTLSSTNQSPVSVIPIPKLAIVERMATTMAACLHLLMSQLLIPESGSSNLLYVASASNIFVLAICVPLRVVKPQKFLCFPLMH